MNRAKLEWYVAGFLLIVVLIIYLVADKQTKKIQHLYTTTYVQQESLLVIKQDHQSITAE